MVTFEWNPELETGNADIDDQHRRLFALANELHTACDLYMGCDEQDRIVDAVYTLAEYVVEHFADEEALMVRCGYPEIGPHRALHEYLASRTLRFTASSINDEDVSPADLAALIVDWLTVHILEEDMRFVRFASKK